jgi:Zn-dependent protease
MSTTQDPVEKPQKATHSPWSFRLLTAYGIPIRIHFTFVLFLTWIALVTQNRGGLLWPAFIVAIFACVLLHELGHALTARKFGIRTRDITLYPIGGVAMLEGRPRARQELWIALAGPAVNFVIAGILMLVLAIRQRGVPILSSDLSRETFLEMLAVANISLALFNLIPAFPMDGGRILRAALALRMPEVKATQTAASIGQGLAIIIGFVGLFQMNIVYMLIAFFVFVGAGQEVSSSVTRSFLRGKKVADAMQIRYRTLSSGESLESAAQALLAGSQHDFPVVMGDEVLGILTRTDIARGLAQEGPSAYVAGVMQRDVKTAHPHLPLERIAEMFTKDDPSPVLVMDEDRLVGMVTYENLSEFIMLEHARSQSRTYGYTA